MKVSATIKVLAAVAAGLALLDAFAVDGATLWMRVPPTNTVADVVRQAGFTPTAESPWQDKLPYETNAIPPAAIDINAANLLQIRDFSPDLAFGAGTLVRHDGAVYLCLTNYHQGAWAPADFRLADLRDVLTAHEDQLSAVASSMTVTMDLLGLAVRDASAAKAKADAVPSTVTNLVKGLMRGESLSVAFRPYSEAIVTNAYSIPEFGVTKYVFSFDADATPNDHATACVSVEPADGGYHNYSVLVEELPPGEPCYQVMFDDLLAHATLYCSPALTDGVQPGSTNCWVLLEEDLPCVVSLREDFPGIVYVERRKLSRHGGAAR